MINNSKLSSLVVRVNKDWPNNMSLGSFFQIYLTKDQLRCWYQGIHLRVSREYYGLFWAKDNKWCSTFGPYLSSFDKLLYLTELPHQNFFPLPSSQTASLDRQPASHWCLTNHLNTWTLAIEPTTINKASMTFVISSPTTLCWWFWVTWISSRFALKKFNTFHSSLCTFQNWYLR